MWSYSSPDEPQDTFEPVDPMPSELVVYKGRVSLEPVPRRWTEWQRMLAEELAREAGVM